MAYRTSCVTDVNLHKHNPKNKISQPKIIKKLMKKTFALMKKYRGNLGQRLGWALQRVVFTLRSFLRICRISTKSEK